MNKRKIVLKVLKIIIISLVLIVPLILNILSVKLVILKNISSADWLGFWASYLGGIFTLLGVILTLNKAESDRKRAEQELSPKIIPNLSGYLQMARKIKKNENSDSTIEFIPRHCSKDDSKNYDVISIDYFNIGQRPAIDVYMNIEKISYSVINAWMKKNNINVLSKDKYNNIYNMSKNKYGPYVMQISFKGVHNPIMECNSIIMFSFLRSCIEEVSENLLRNCDINFKEGYRKQYCEMPLANLIIEYNDIYKNSIKQKKIRNVYSIYCQYDIGIVDGIHAKGKGRTCCKVEVTFIENTRFNLHSLYFQ